MYVPHCEDCGTQLTGLAQCSECGPVHVCAACAPEHDCFQPHLLMNGYLDDQEVVLAESDIPPSQARYAQFLLTGELPVTLRLV